MYYIPDYIENKFDDNFLIIKNQLNNAIIRLKDPIYIKEYQKLLHSGTDCISTELEKCLNNEDILIDNTVAKETVNTITNLLDKVAIFTILPTENCNFRCSYCYEDHNESSMTNEQLDIIFSCIEKLLDEKKINKLFLNWFGGEPLLEKNTIIKFNKAIAKLTDKYSINFKSTITTNGYLLNVDTFKKLYNSNVKNYQITLDGFNHDKTRYLANGEGSLTRIIENLKAISNLDISFDYHITLRRNILSDDTDMAWYDYLHSIFGKDKRFNVSVHPVIKYEKSDKKLNYLTETETLTKKHQDYLLKLGFAENRQNIGNYINNICYASFKYGFVFRPNGEICKCTVDFNNKLNKVGIICKSIKVDEKINNIWIRNTMEEKCYSCKQYAYCLNKICPRAVIEEGKAICPR